MTLSEKMYMADSMLKLTEVLEDISEDYYVEEGLVDKETNEMLFDVVDGIVEKMEKRIDEE